jgi:hypothetical protein
MIFGAPLDRVRLGRGLRMGILAIVALLVAHDAIFLAQYGAGPDFPRAMAEGGHDGYWLPFTVTVILGGGLLLLRALNTIRVLDLQALRFERVELPAPSYATELLGIWRHLFPLVTLLFAIQENVEHLAEHGHLLGLGALAGPEYPLALPVIAAVSFALAALGALIRWRIATLRARIATARERRAMVADETVAPEWGPVHAAAAHRWTLHRLDAGRAPPRILPA